MAPSSSGSRRRLRSSGSSSPALHGLSLTKTTPHAPHPVLSTRYTPFWVDCIPRYCRCRYCRTSISSDPLHQYSSDPVSLNLPSRMHALMLRRLLRAPKWYFDTTPIGALLALFSKGLFEFADAPHFPHMLHPVSPICHTLILFFLERHGHSGRAAPRDARQPAQVHLHRPHRACRLRRRRPTGAHPHASHVQHPSRFLHITG